MDCELLSKVYINLIDQKEPIFQFQKKVIKKDKKNKEEIVYSKKIIKPSKLEIENHKEFMKKNSKEIFLIKLLLVEFSKSIFLSNFISGKPESLIDFKNILSKSGYISFCKSQSISFSNSSFFMFLFFNLITVAYEISKYDFLLLSFLSL